MASNKKVLELEEENRSLRETIEVLRVKVSKLREECASLREEVCELQADIARTRGPMCNRCGKDYGQCAVSWCGAIDGVTEEDLRTKATEPTCSCLATCGDDRNCPACNGPT